MAGISECVRVRIIAVRGGCLRKAGHLRRSNIHVYYLGIMAMRWENIMAAAELHRLGLRPPAVSWGVLLQQVQNVRTLAVSP